MRQRSLLVLALLVGAFGIAILWAAGVEFPVAVPPGLLILSAGALLVATVRARWADAVGGLLGLFVTVGFVLSGIYGEGFANLLGHHGPAVAIGQLVQLVGVVGAAVLGAQLAFRRD